MTVSATPDRLVFLGGTRWALVIGEVDDQGAHSAPGALSIAHLDRHDGAWTLDHLWPEIAFVGSSGEPANAGEEEHRFGRHELFFAREKWCGMGECSGAIDTVALEDAAPVVLSSILAGARFPSGGAPLDIDCAPYAVTATIGPPRSAAGLFSVTHAGWTAPKHRLQPRTPLQLTTDYVREGRTLRMAPDIVVPECDR